MLQEWNLAPKIIEDRSFSIITNEAGNHNWRQDEWVIVQRLVHTSADFDYVNNTVISPGAIEAGKKALKSGATIVTDTKMALCGINTTHLTFWGNQLICLIADERTQRRARETGTTRALAAVDLVFEFFFNQVYDGSIWIFGNAPTALFRLLEKLEQEPSCPRPKLIVAFPVGFVNATEAKKSLLAYPLPHISNHGRKGGSNVAAAAVNALIKLATVAD
ncbi:MAG: hypothetical protein AMR96_00175 [Candidatus Adiutrix intracellularis]|nr:MAG: hypothetical protein AMR96_00175 [Candidatus Adiutrix intracellularis]